VAGNLKRRLGLGLLTLYGLGSIVGAGIYVLVGEVAGKAGMYAPLAFLLAAGIAAFTGFSYAELSARFPHSAGEARYVFESFGSRWLAGAVGWAVVFTGIVSSATLSSGVVGYVVLFVDAPAWLVIVLFVSTLGAIACRGIAESAGLAAIMTLLSVAGLILVVVAAGDSLLTLPARWPQLVPEFSAVPLTGIVLGSFLAFYAFIGFEDMANVAEEVHDPGRTMPTAILLALCMAVVLYVLVALVAVLSLEPHDLAAGGAPLVAIVGPDSWLSPLVIAVLSAIAITNSVLPQLIMGSRVMYGLARQASAPAFMGRVNATTGTPLQATVMMIAAIMVLAVAVPLVTLAEITSFIVLLIFMLVNASALWLKLSGRRAKDTVAYSPWLSVAGVLTCLFLLIFQLLFGM
jgi:APA family basic amino acid/polyamine antiporter